MAKKDYESKTEELLQPIAEKNGVWIYDVEYVKEGSDWYLRAYIEKDGGVTIEDCESVSRELSDILDVEDFISDNYILEVSSPGLGRRLTRDRHLDNSMGMDVEVKLYEAIDDCKEYAGKLVSYDKDNLTIEDDTKKYTFIRKNIAVIKLALDF